MKTKPNIKKKQQKTLSELEILIRDAKDSKHTAGVLLIAENKAEIQSKVVKLLAKYLPEETEENKASIASIKKTIAVFSEYVFSQTLSVLIEDKK